MKPLYLISDIHLGVGDGQEKSSRANRFIAFADYVRRQEGDLVIAGDLFDFWFEYKHVMPRGHLDVLMALRALVKAGAKVSLVAGNHDFWVGETFTKDIGISVYADHQIIEAQGMKLYITHGDGLDRRDKGYRFLKRVLRNPLNIRLFRLIHPDWGFALAHGSSNLSREYQPFETDDSDYAEHAAKHLKDGYDAVIMGHTHRSHVIQTEAGVYMNLGEWNREKRYGLLRDGKLTLEKWADA